MSFGSWLKSHESVIVHTVGVVGIAATSIARSTGCAPAVAGIALITSAYHIGQAMTGNGPAGNVGEDIANAAADLKSLIADANGAKGAATPGG